MSYCDVAFADEYFSARSFSEAWTGDGKANLLETATLNIKDYCAFEDEKGAYVYDESSDDYVIPEWLKRATCEQALYLANLGKDPTQADKKTTMGVSSADGAAFNKSFRADILGPACRRILENNGGILASGATADENEVQWSFRDK